MLNRTVRTALRRLRRDESGVALVAVMGFMLIGVLITILIGTSIVSGMSHTTAARANVQAQAAAEAGIAAAFAGIQVSAPNPQACSTVGAVYRNATGQLPIYEARVYVGASTVPSCPTGAGQVRIVSTGTATAPGVAGNKSGDKVYLEATYAVGAVDPSGTAVYIYNGGAVNAFTVAMGDVGTTGNIQMPTGDFKCSTASTINGDIIVAAGSVEMSNSCKVTGSIKASGGVKLSNTVQVLGDISSSSGQVYLGSGTFVGGNVSANGATEIRGTVEKSVTTTGNAYVGESGWIKQNLTVGGLLTAIQGNGYVQGNVSSRATGTTEINPDRLRVGGSLAIGGDLNTWGYAWNVPSSTATENEKRAYFLKTNNKVIGAITYLQTGLTLPVAAPVPVVPTWVDWKYDRTDWISAGFANLITVPSSLCNIDNQSSVVGTPAYNLVQQFNTINTPTVVDTTACNQFNFSLSAHLRLKFKTDVAFVGKSFKMEDLQIDSFNTTKHKIYFLVSDGQPTTPLNQCNNGAGNIEANNGVIIGANIAAMLYTPCTISLNNGSKWRGQLYSGGIAVSSNDGLTYVPVGIPGTNLDGVTGGTPSSSLGGLVSLRNLDSAP